MKYIEIYASTFFTLCLQLVTDIILDLRLDFYRTMEKGPDLVPLLIFMGIYPAYSYIFLNFFPYKKHLMYKIVYILFHTIFVTLFEWLSLLSGYFTYVNWELWYSSLCDIAIFVILSSNILLIRKLVGMDYIKK